MEKFSNRDKLILAGLFLSKFDETGLAALGFSGFTEAYNVIASSLKGRATSLKNYRDEFDPYFPNKRKGWHGRPLRDHCRQVMEKYAALSLEEFSGLIKSEISDAGELSSLEEMIDDANAGSFAKRLITGQAAEKYFESRFALVKPFQNCQIINTTALGCGFDYRLVNAENHSLVVEVKGLNASTGSVQMTSKEYRVAEFLRDRFYLFIVRNFAEKPFHTLFQDPVNCDLVFEERKQTVVQTSWSTAIN